MLNGLALAFRAGPNGLRAKRFGPKKPGFFWTRKIKALTLILSGFGLNGLKTGSKLNKSNYIFYHLNFILK